MVVSYSTRNFRSRSYASWSLWGSSGTDKKNRLLFLGAACPGMVVLIHTAVQRSSEHTPRATRACYLLFLVDLVSTRELFVDTKNIRANEETSSFFFLYFRDFSPKFPGFEGGVTSIKKNSTAVQGVTNRSVPILILIHHGPLWKNSHKERPL